MHHKMRVVKVPSVPYHNKPNRERVPYHNTELVRATVAVV